MLPVYTPWKHLKTFAFLVFSEGIKREYWPEMSLRVLRGFKFLLNLQTRSFYFYKKNAALHKYFHIKKKIPGNCPVGTHPQRCNVPAIQGIFREHVKEKYFLKELSTKSCFYVKRVWFDDNKCWSSGKFQ